jgi:hypothetical protein
MPIWDVPSLVGSNWPFWLVAMLIGAGIALPRALRRRAALLLQVSALLLLAAWALCVQLRRF